MALAAAEAKVPPWQISFKSRVADAQQLPSLALFVRAAGRWLPKPLSSASPRTGLAIVPIASSLAASKRRPKSHDLLQRPRHEYQRLAA